MAYFKSSILTMDCSGNVDTLLRRQHQGLSLRPFVKMTTDQMALLARSGISPAIYSQLSFSCSFLTGFPAASISHLQCTLHNAARGIFPKSSFHRSCCSPAYNSPQIGSHLNNKSGRFAWGPREPFFFCLC